MIKLENVKCAFCNSSNIHSTGVYEVSTLIPNMKGQVYRHFFHCDNCGRKNCIDEKHDGGELTISLQD